VGIDIAAEIIIHLHIDLIHLVGKCININIIIINLAWLGSAQQAQQECKKLSSNELHQLTFYLSNSIQLPPKPSHSLIQWPSRRQEREREINGERNETNLQDLQQQ